MMTKKEAIERLKEGEPFSEIFDPVWDEALNMAIKVLSTQTCEEDKLAEYEKAIKDIKAQINSNNRGSCNYFIVDEIEKIVNKIPTNTEPTTITENITNGIDEGIRCAMCTNPMANNRGCDGMCKVDKTMYRKVLDVINNTLYKGNFTMPTRPKAKWIKTYKDELTEEQYHKCSNCDHEVGEYLPRFCEVCGAEMESE